MKAFTLLKKGENNNSFYIYLKKIHELLKFYTQFHLITLI